jgi:hypothetical protein
MAEMKETNKIKHLLKKIIRIVMESLLGAMILWILFILASRYLCMKALENIGKKTGTKITVDKMRLNLNGSVEIEGLTVKTDSNRFTEPIFKAQATKANVSLPSMFLLKPRIKRISLNESEVNLIYDSNNNKWNLPQFRLIAGKISIDELPIIYLNDTKFTYLRYEGKNKTILAQTSFRGIFVSQTEKLENLLKKGEKVFHFEMNCEQFSNFGSIVLSGTFKERQIELRGSMLSEGAEKDTFLQAQSVKAVFQYAQNGDFSLNADVNNFSSGQRLFAEHFAEIRTLSSYGEWGLAFQHFLDRGQIKGALDGEFIINGNFTEIKNSRIAGRILCHEIVYCDKNFEYPLEKIQGPVDLTETSAELKYLTGIHEESVFLINGYVNIKQGQSRRHINISSNKVNLDKDVYSALATEGKKIWDDFSPSGSVSVEYTFDKKQSSNNEIEIKITPLDCRAVWKKLTYPVNNLTGNLIIRQNEAELVNLTSTNGDEKIIVNGKIAKANANNNVFDINVSAENIEPNSFTRHIQWSELSNLFQIKKPFFLNDVNLIGAVNFTGQFKRGPQQQQGDYNIKIEFPNNELAYSGLPYSFNGLKGNVYFQNDLIKFENLKTAVDNPGAPGIKTQITIGGQVKTINHVFNNAELNIQATGVIFDERLGALLPKKNQSLYFQFKPAGVFDLNIEKLIISGSSESKNTVEAAGSVYLHHINLNTEPALSQLNGPLRLEASYKSGKGLSNGKINAQGCSIRIREKILTDLNAEIVYNTNNKSWHSENFNADFYGGKMNGNAELNEGASYLLNAGFDKIDLLMFLSDKNPNAAMTPEDTNAVKKGTVSEHTQGTMDASLNLAGQLGRPQDNLGRCRLKITDMKAGKVSTFGKLLNILQLTEPRDYTFEQMVVDSYIKGRQLLLNVDISGQTTAFEGEGIIDLRGMVIDLLLNARGKRPFGTSPGPLQALTEGLGQGIVQLSITGNIYSPQIEVVPLPVIKGTLGLFGAEAKSPKK